MFQALDMVEHVRRSFHEILRELTWLEDSTKKVAQEKVGTSTCSVVCLSCACCSKLSQSLFRDYYC